MSHIHGACTAAERLTIPKFDQTSSFTTALSPITNEAYCKRNWDTSVCVLISYILWIWQLKCNILKAPLVSLALKKSVIYNYTNFWNAKITSFFLYQNIFPSIYTFLGISQTKFCIVINYLQNNPANYFHRHHCNIWVVQKLVFYITTIDI